MATAKKVPAKSTTKAAKPPAMFDDLVRAIDQRTAAFAGARQPTWRELEKTETAVMACAIEAIAMKADVATARAFLAYAHPSGAEHARATAAFGSGLARRGDRDAATSALHDAERAASETALDAEDRATVWSAIARGWKALNDASGVARALAELDAVFPETGAIPWSPALRVVADAVGDTEDLDRCLALLARCEKDGSAHSALAPTLVRCIAAAALREDFARLQTLLAATATHSNGHALALEGLGSAALQFVRAGRLDTARQLVASWPHERDSSFEQTLRLELIDAAHEAGHVAFARELAEGEHGAPAARAERFAAAAMPEQAREALAAQSSIDSYSARPLARAAARLGDAALTLPYLRSIGHSDLASTLRDALRFMATNGDAAAAAALHEGAVKLLAKIPHEDRARGLAELGIACAVRGEEDAASALFNEAIAVADGAAKGWQRNLVLRDLATRFAESGHHAPALLAYKKCTKSDKPSVAARLAYGAARRGDLSTALAMIDAIDPGTSAPTPGPDRQIPRAWRVSLFVACDVAHQLAGIEMQTSVRMMVGTL